MSEIKIELQAADINQAVADAIVKSVLGDAIAKSVAAHVKSLVTSSYNNPIEGVINEIIKAKILSLVNETYRDQIEKAVHEKMAGEAATRLVTLAVEKFIKAMY